MSKKAKRKKRMMLIHSRRSVIMIALIAVMVLIINLISASYSWFTPQPIDGTGLEYSFNGKARSESCTHKTYLGTKVTSSNIDEHDDFFYNQIDYNASPRTTAVSIAAGATQYFKTEIINSDQNNESCVSLFITTMPACTLAVTYPSNTVRKIASTSSDYYIIRGATVKKRDVQDVNGPGLLTVEWFVTNTGASAISVNPANLYITYN